MFSEFHFKGFQPDESVQREANEVLDRILNLAPYDSIAAALIERIDSAYRCAVDIYSKHGPFIACSSGTTAQEALNHMEKSLSGTLLNWRERKLLKPSFNKLPRSTCSVA